MLPLRPEGRPLTAGETVVGTGQYVCCHYAVHVLVLVRNSRVGPEFLSHDSPAPSGRSPHVHVLALFAHLEVASVARNRRISARCL